MSFRSIVSRRAPYVSPFYIKISRDHLKKYKNRTDPFPKSTRLKCWTMLNYTRIIHQKIRSQYCKYSPHHRHAIILIMKCRANKRNINFILSAFYPFRKVKVLLPFLKASSQDISPYSVSARWDQSQQ